MRQTLKYRTKLRNYYRNLVSLIYVHELEAKAPVERTESPLGQAARHMHSGTVSYGHETLVLSQTGINTCGQSGQNQPHTPDFQVLSSSHPIQYKSHDHSHNYLYMEELCRP